jgi:hypothetical protein
MIDELCLCVKLVYTVKLMNICVSCELMCDELC